jgi:phosphatidylinositol glycan class B
MGGLMGGEFTDQRDARRWFWAILLVAIALRVAAFDPYSAHHPDETIQYLEQAHRIVFGYGVVPWEFRYFIRSWLIPLMLVPPMQLGEWLDPGGTLYLILPRAMIAAINFTPVVAAWFVGRRLSLQHAIVGMAVMAIWVECILFSVQTLSESLAISCFFVAAALLQPKARMSSIAIAGMLLAFAGLFRFQFGPAIGIYVLLVARNDWRIWRCLFLGGVPVIIGGGVIDLVMGLAPYEWILTNYRMNIVDQRMLKIGGHDNWTYVRALVGTWNVFLLLIPFLAALVWKQHRALIAAAIVNLLVHQLIGHKEYRYIWLSLQIILLLAAFGSVELLRSTLWGRRLKNPGGTAAAAMVIALWGAASLFLAVQLHNRTQWRSSGETSRLAAEVLACPDVCGIAVPADLYTQFGYVLVHTPKPIFLLFNEGGASTRTPGEAAPGFNAMLVEDGQPSPVGFPIKGKCAGGKRDTVCLYLRPGRCRLDERTRPYLFQETLNRLDM